jgi:hypothetical protein
MVNPSPTKKFKQRKVLVFQTHRNLIIGRLNMNSIEEPKATSGANQFFPMTVKGCRFIIDKAC